MQVHKDRIVYITLVAFALHPGTLDPPRRSLNGTRFVLHFRSLVGPQLRENRRPSPSPARVIYYTTTPFVLCGGNKNRGSILRMRIP